ncbi:MAG: divalent-cation tolerance protein CutA [Dinoroseobacter sp.]|nr:divalent-cation tolerance protein CutA [Dinoroseobacter sp.]
MPLSVSVTCPDIETARSIARSALERKLVACANVLPGVESHFWWEGQVSHESEVLLVLKTTDAHRAHLVALVAQEHPYDLPALTWSADGAPDAVTDWIAAETKSGG